MKCLAAMILPSIQNYLKWILQMKTTTLLKIYSEHFLNGKSLKSQLKVEKMRKSYIDSLILDCSMFLKHMQTMTMKLDMCRVWIILLLCCYFTFKIKLLPFGVLCTYSIVKIGDKFITLTLQNLWIYLL